tara:strand:+ start:1690 stop:2301 length:612 start_codon:yes stop_codon:yes gene_type:complete
LSTSAIVGVFVGRGFTVRSTVMPSASSAGAGTKSVRVVGELLSSLRLPGGAGAGEPPAPLGLKKPDTFASLRSPTLAMGDAPNAGSNADDDAAAPPPKLKAAAGKPAGALPPKPKTAAAGETASWSETCGDGVSLALSALLLRSGVAAVAFVSSVYSETIEESLFSSSSFAATTVPPNANGDAAVVAPAESTPNVNPPPPPPP